jgi:hypothetical protein
MRNCSSMGAPQMRGRNQFTDCANFTLRCDTNRGAAAAAAAYGDDGNLGCVKMLRDGEGDSA